MHKYAECVDPNESTVTLADTHRIDTVQLLDTFERGVPGIFGMTLKELIKRNISDFIHRLVFSRDSRCEEITDDEYESVFYNHVAGHFGLHKQEDSTKALIDPVLLERCEAYILSTVNIAGVISQMARDCLTVVRAHFAQSFLDEALAESDFRTYDAIYHRFSKNLLQELTLTYGAIDAQDIFYFDGDARRYKVVNDTTLLVCSITCNLRKTGVVNPFNPAHVIGKEEDKVKLMLIGEKLAYVQSLEAPIRRSLAQYVREEPEQGWQMLKQIEALATATPLASSPFVAQIQHDFWQKEIAPYARAFEANPTTACLERLIEHAERLLERYQGAETAIVEMMANMLIWFVHEGNEPLLDVLLAVPPESRLAGFFNKTDINGDTALMSAVSHGHAQIVAKLLKSPLMTKENVNYVNEKIQCTALMDAALLGHTHVVAEFLKSPLITKENVNFLNDITMGNALMAAAYKGNALVVAEFLKPSVIHKVDLNCVDMVNKITALTIAAMSGHAPVVAEFLKSPYVTSIHVNYISDDDKNKATALMWASYKGHYHVVVEFLNPLVRTKVDPNYVYAPGQNTALTWAVISNIPSSKKSEIVRLLKEAGADMSRKS